MKYKQLHPGLSALVETGILFLPGIPAYFLLWPNLQGSIRDQVQIIVYIYLMAGGLLIGLRRWNRNELGFNLDGIWLSLACGMALVVGRLLVIISIAWPGDPPALTLSKLAGDILFYFVLVGLVEEYIFRGLMYRALDSWRGTKAAILGSTLGFILFHIGWRSPLMGIAALLFGIIFALIRWRAGGIVGLILVHGLIDITSVELLPSISLEQLGRPEIQFPALLVLGYILILGIPIFLWKAYPRIWEPS